MGDKQGLMKDQSFLHNLVDARLRNLEHDLEIVQVPIIDPAYDEAHNQYKDIKSRILTAIEDKRTEKLGDPAD